MNTCAEILPASLELRPIDGLVARTNPLAFAMQPQAMTNWCWSAVATSIGLFYATGQWTQCAVVNTVLQKTTCCTTAGASECNVPSYLELSFAVTKSFGSKVSGKPLLTAVSAEIDAGRPLGLRVGWSGGGGHFLAVYGYASNTQMLNIADSIYGSSVQAFATFPSTYHGGGTWTHTYYTKPGS